MGPAGASSRIPRIPLAPLLATLAVQTLATMALFSLPAIAPAVSRALGVNGELVGGFVAVAYGTGIISALVSPGLIHRYGGARATQAVLLAAAGMVAIGAGGGTLVSLAIAAVVLGFGYGAAAPASTHLLVPHTPKAVFNMVMSLRQIGVPLGGVLGALVLPPLAVALGWQGALLLELGPLLILILLMELPRRRWDSDRDPNWKVFGRTLLQPFLMLRDKGLRRLSVASFVYSAVQLCFVAFMTVQLTTVVGFGLVGAGRVLALYQIAGTISRPVWGWIADRYLTPMQTLGVLGLGMAIATAAAGQFTAGMPSGIVIVVVLLAGLTAAGYTGVAYAEYARLGGSRRTEATGLGTAMMFAAVMSVPPLFGLGVAASGGYAVPYGVLTCLAGAAALLAGVTR